MRWMTRCLSGLATGLRLASFIATHANGTRHDPPPPPHERCSGYWPPRGQRWPRSELWPHAEAAPVVISAVHGGAGSITGSPVRVTVGAVLNLPASVRTGAESSSSFARADDRGAAANARSSRFVSADPAERLDRMSSRGNVYYSVPSNHQQAQCQKPAIVAVIKGTLQCLRNRIVGDVVPA
jgi:hypothetical protein